SFSCGGLFPWPVEYLSNVDVGSGAGPSGPNSFQRSTTAHGLRHAVESPVTTCAVAVATTPWLVMPASFEKYVGSALPRASFRNTLTFTDLCFGPCIPGGQAGNVTSASVTLGA